MKYFHPKKWFRLVNESVMSFFLNYILTDKAYLKYQYKKVFGKQLDLKNPQTYNEKMQWLKLYDRNPKYHILADKHAVKQFVTDTIGKEYVIETYGVWKKFDDIDFNSLPNEFVLKCTHDSASTVICKDKKSFDFASARKKLSTALKVDYYHYENRQWAYKDIEPQIIAEKYMVDESGTELKDYKFFCFDGKFKTMFIATDRPHDTKFDFYDIDFNLLPFTNGHPHSGLNRSKPDNYDKMIQLAEKLSENIPHVRVDFYSINGNIYFGEMTLYHWGGMMPFEPEEWDYTFGSWIKLPKTK